MNTLQDRAVSFLSVQAALETNSLQPEIESSVIGRSLTPKPSKSGKANGTRSIPNGLGSSGQSASGSSAENDCTGLVGGKDGHVSTALTPPDPIDAKQFIVGMRKADRAESIRLISAFMGNYDTAQDFGSQELIARTLANRQLSTRPMLAASGKELSNAFRSLAGFTSGLPDHTAKRLANLQAQEKAAVEERAERNREYQDESRSWDDRLLAKGLLDLAGERLVSIRTDMDRLF